MADLLGRRRVFMAGLVLFALASLAGGFAELGGTADRGPRGPGPRRGDPVAGRALDRDDHLPRRRGAQQGARRVGRRGRQRRRRGRAARRRADRHARLGVGAVGERADRARRRGARSDADRGEPLRRRRRATSTSRARSASRRGCRCWSTRWSTRPTRAGARPRRSGCWRVSAALLAAFVAIELRSAAPLVPFRIFRLRTLTGANVVGLLVGASLFSMFFFISLYMQQVLGYSPIKSGFSYLPLALTIIVVGGHRVAARHAHRLQAGAGRPGIAFIAAGLDLVRPGVGRRQLPGRRAAARRCSRRSGSGSRSCRSRSRRSRGWRSARRGSPAG